MLQSLGTSTPDPAIMSNSFFEAAKSDLCRVVDDLIALCSDPNELINFDQDLAPKLRLLADAWIPYIFPDGRFDDPAGERIFSKLISLQSFLEMQQGEMWKFWIRINSLVLRLYEQYLGEIASPQITLQTCRLLKLAINQFDPRFTWYAPGTDTEG